MEQEYTSKKGWAVSTRELDQLGTALAKAQAEIQGVLKDSKGYNYRYADLASVWDGVREPLTKHGLSIVQLPCEAPTGHVGLTTILLHASGQSVSERFFMPVKNPTDPQQVGSALTYARRYALMAAVGVAPEDDDAAVAAGKPGNKPLDVDTVKKQLQSTFDAAKTAEEKKQAYLQTKASAVPQAAKDAMLKHMSEVIKGMNTNG